MYSASFFPLFMTCLLYSVLWVILIPLHPYLTLSLQNHKKTQSTLFIPQFQSGWYALQVQNGPIQYSTTPTALAPWKQCLSHQSPLYEGDLMIIKSHSPCRIKIKRLSGSIQLDLGLPLHLNRASVDDLTQVPGIGPKRAHTLIRHRPFKSLNDLLHLKGIGRKTLKKWAPFLTLKDPILIGPIHHKGLLQ